MKQFIIKLFLLSLCCFQYTTTQANSFVGVQWVHTNFDSSIVLNNDEKQEFYQLSIDEDETGYSLFAGFEQSELLRFEGGFVNLGEWGVSKESFNFQDELSYVYAAWSPYYKFTQNFSVTAKLGYLLWNSSISGENGELLPNEGGDGTEFFSSIGGRYKISQSLSVTIDFSNLELSYVDASSVNLGVLYSF